MKNNKFIKHKIIKIIDNLYKLSGKQEIPDVKKICSAAKIDRRTAGKFLHTWWDKYYIKKDKKASQINLSAEVLEENFLAKTNASIQCLSKEIVLYSELLNTLPNSSFPLGNYILSILDDVESQIFVALNHINELRVNKKIIQQELKKVLKENTHLQASYLSLQNQTQKELNELKRKLDVSRREALAVNHRLKSLKRDRRRISLKPLVNDYSTI
jgi:hypothetical protein